MFLLYELFYEWVLLLTLIQETCWLSVRVWVKPFGPWGYWKGTGETKERPSARCHYAEPESNRIWKIHFTPCLCPVLINVSFQFLTFPEHCRRVSGNRCPGAWRRRRTDLPSLPSTEVCSFSHILISRHLSYLTEPHNSRFTWKIDKISPQHWKKISWGVA